MTLFLGLVSCNSSATVAEESPQSRFLKSVISLGNDFLNVFTSFGDMVGGVLGFNSNTKKSDVGAYFKKVHDTVEGTKTALEKIVSDMKNEGNPNAGATDTVVKKLVSETLDKIIEGAKTASEAIGTEGTELIGNVAAQNSGGVAGDVDKLIEGVKSIVEVVLKEGKHDAGDNKKAEDGSTERDNNAAGMLFASNNAGANASAKKSVSDATKAIGAVTGADILQAMIKNGGDAATLAKNSAANGNAANAKKDAIIAGGVALRAMAKGGKFANSSDTDVTTEIRRAATSAVTKALDVLTIAIRKTIDSGLREVKDAMKINANGSPVTSDKIISEVTSK
ncbi:Variable outer membrane protein (plasmid) [Borrelia miyamotoi FR64b]|uniref:Variable large protein n=1 Tax=Borrelia miyamotoi FR64b TaxID=1292392 RepID=W5SH39_9SPIR|nr:variable large family protein [Borrelia miyamotoi]AHH05973.1 Variable outer membrane protein [Borrelia miyamotoi FR64b]WAZ71361.1 variable large family protein [Borrelia miyamotoi]